MGGEEGCGREVMGVWEEGEGCGREVRSVGEKGGELVALLVLSSSSGPVFMPLFTASHHSLQV